MSAPFHQHETEAPESPAPTSSAPRVDLAAYDAFIAAKRVQTIETGFAPPLPLSSILFPFQRDVITWALRLGRAALFESFGLGKTLQQLEIGRQVCAKTNGRFLIVAPLGVRQEFMRDAELLGHGVNYVTGDYSRGAAGFWVENGIIQYPVHEITIAGNLKEMLMGIREIGSDVLVRGSKHCGSILVERMTVAGA